MSTASSREATTSSIAAIYATLLDLPETFDRSKTFIQLGGQSITAARLQIELVKAFDVRIPYATLFAHGTVGELADAVIGALEEKRCTS